MTASIKPCTVSILLAGAFAAHAADAPSSTPPSSPVAALPADAGDGPAPSAQIAVREAGTGRLRAATPAEAAALHAAGPQALRTAAVPRNLTRYHRSGATGARLSDSAMSYAMVVRQPDGRMTEYCFDSREAAEAALSTPVVVPVHNALPTE